MYLFSIYIHSLRSRLSADALERVHMMCVCVCLHLNVRKILQICFIVSRKGFSRETSIRLNSIVCIKIDYPVNFYLVTPRSY